MYILFDFWSELLRAVLIDCARTTSWAMLRRKGNEVERHSVAIHAADVSHAVFARHDT